jgi:predicted secreted protein
MRLEEDRQREIWRMPNVGESLERENAHFHLNYWSSVLAAVLRLFRESQFNIMRNVLLGVTHSRPSKPQGQLRDIIASSTITWLWKIRNNHHEIII